MKKTTEPPMPKQFVNLRECIDDMWVAINQTDDMGQYYYTNITEGNYYIDYLKPPGGGYNFTLPNVGGDDENVAIHVRIATPLCEKHSSQMMIRNTEKRLKCLSSSNSSQKVNYTSCSCCRFLPPLPSTSSLGTNCNVGRNC